MALGPWLAESFFLTDWMVQTPEEAEAHQELKLEKQKTQRHKQTQKTKRRTVIVEGRNTRTIARNDPAAIAARGANVQGAIGAIGAAGSQLVGTALGQPVMTFPAPYAAPAPPAPAEADNSMTWILVGGLALLGLGGAAVTMRKK